MFSWLARAAAACIGPVLQFRPSSKDEDDRDDSLLWSRDLCPHSAGEFSIGVVQANECIEDHSQVETGSAGTFVGIYDGHGGPEASCFVLDHLFPHLMRIARENGSISADVLRNAFSATEAGFLSLVRRSVAIKPLIAATGSCCLVGVIWKKTLYVANLGDSRAVLGCVGRSGNIIAEQLTQDHNVSVEEVRQELRSLHPDDSQIVVQKQGVWRVKGIIQLAGPLRRPVLSAEPSIRARVVQPQDKFLIFASDGLWEHLTNQQAVEIVYAYPRKGIARRLIRIALKEAARKREMRYQDLKRVDKGVRRFFHDDITVVVLYMDHELVSKDVVIPDVSVKGFVDSVGTSDFSILKDI
ncbi:unnamed protein product [Victoria cruziana]